MSTAFWRGKADRWVALDVHTDTVSVEQMTDDPFDGRVEDGRVWGTWARWIPKLAWLLSLLFWNPCRKWIKS